MSVVKSVPVEDIAARGSIKDSDAARLIKAFGLDPHITEEEALTLLALNKACPIQGPQWTTFFIDAVAEFLINQTSPEGYVTVEKAQWLIDRISVDGWISSRTEFDLVLAVIERARWFPLSLGLFAMRQIKGAIEHGCGPLRPRQDGRPGVMLADDVTLIRKVLFAFGAETRVAVTQAETRMLVEINAAHASGSAPGAWYDLLCKSIANFVLAANGYAVPERRLALAAESQLELYGSVEDMVNRCLASSRLEHRWASAHEAALTKLERQRIEIVTQEELIRGDELDVIEALRVADAGLPSEVVNYLYREGLIGVGADAYSAACVA